jgi:hypothetical protein
MTRKNGGVVTFESEGQEYQLVVDMNALADFEVATGLNAMSILEGDVSQLSALHIRALFWAMLVQNHPEMTIKDAGRLVLSGMEAMNRAVAVAMPQATAAEDTLEAEKL